MPTPLVIDLSHHNTIPSSLDEAKQAGIIGCIHKATEGTSFVDSKVKSRYKLCKDVGMLWGVYHFLTDSSSGAAQAEHFVSTLEELDIIDGDTLVAADHEDTDASLSLLREFLETVRDLTSRMPVVYSGHVLKDQLINYVGADFPVRLWLAQYTSGEPTLPNGFSDYWLWQYTDDGECPGIDPPTDLNHTELSFDEFTEGWAGHLIPAPDDLIVTVKIEVDTPPGVTVKVVMA